MHARRRRLADRLQRRRVGSAVGQRRGVRREPDPRGRRSATSALEPQQLLEALFADVREFAKGAAQSDDITAMVLRYGWHDRGRRTRRERDRRLASGSSLAVVVWNGVYDMLLARGAQGLPVPARRSHAGRPWTRRARSRPTATAIVGRLAIAALGHRRSWATHRCFCAGHDRRIRARSLEPRVRPCTR